MNRYKSIVDVESFNVAFYNKDDLVALEREFGANETGDIWMSVEDHETTLAALKKAACSKQLIRDLRWVLKNRPKVSKIRFCLAQQR